MRSKASPLPDTATDIGDGASIVPSTDGAGRTLHDLKWSRRKTTSSFSRLYLAWTVKDCNTSEVLQDREWSMFYLSGLDEIVFRITRSDAYRSMVPRRNLPPDASPEERRRRRSNPSDGSMSNNVVFPGDKGMDDTWTSDRTCGSLYIAAETWVLREEHFEELKKTVDFYGSGENSKSTYPYDYPYPPEPNPLTRNSRGEYPGTNPHTSVIPEMFMSYATDHTYQTLDYTWNNCSQ